MSFFGNVENEPKPRASILARLRGLRAGFVEDSEAAPVEPKFEGARPLRRNPGAPPGSLGARLRDGDITDVEPIEVSEGEPPGASAAASTGFMDDVEPDTGLAGIPSAGVSPQPAAGSLPETPGHDAHARATAAETGDPWLRWHVTRMLRRLELKPEAPMRALETGIFSDLVVDRIADAERRDNFVEAVKSLGRGSLDRVVDAVRRNARITHYVLLTIAAALFIGVGIGSYAVTGLVGLQSALGAGAGNF